MWQRIVVVLMSVALLCGASACSGTAESPPPTVTETLVVPMPSATSSSSSPEGRPYIPTALPTTDSRPTVSPEASFDQAVTWLGRVTHKGTAVTIYGLSKALNCILTPADWARIAPYASILYQKAAGKPLSALTSPKCDAVKGTLEAKAAELYQKLSTTNTK